MCTTCGCSDDTRTRITDVQADQSVAVNEHAHQDPQHNHGHHPGHNHDHQHSHEHHHHEHTHHQHDRDHGPVEGHGKTISLEADLLAKNDRIAERNRGWFQGRNILALNLVSSPGSGKTTLLERTIRDLMGDLSISVVEGDQETANDAQRIKDTGCRVVQINTGTGCHLEADMLARSVEQLQPPMDSVVMIENVGNLVCPALFDLGEQAKVAILSVTEGEDKPVKYPHMFRASQIIIINKIDLLPYVRFDMDKCIEYARKVNPNIQVFQLSAESGEGMQNWYHWLKTQTGQKELSAAS